MVQAADVLPYLLALRSFLAQVDAERVVVVCDPSMGAAECAILRVAVPHIELRRAEEFRCPELPTRGTWERLTAITEYAEQGYVLQLDADTVTLGELSEVGHAVKAGQGFVLGERPQQNLLTLLELREYVKSWQRPDLHVQGVAEYLMAEAGLTGQRYVRGCSGFTGFPQNKGLRSELLQYSQRMQALLKQRWNEWGTEQVASNYLVAGLPGTQVLPFPDYATPDQMQHSPRFVHFIGSMRFESGFYGRTAQHVLATLR